MATRTKQAKQPYKTLNMRCVPEFYTSMANAAKMEGLPVSTWVRRIVVLAMRKKRAA